MGKLKYLIVLICLGFGLISCGSENSSGDNSSSVKANKSSNALSVTKDFDGVLLTIESGSDTYEPGENFVVTVKVTNNTGENIYLKKNDDGCENGGECTHHEVGIRIGMGDIYLVDADRFGKGETDGYAAHKIAPGESLVREMNYVTATATSVSETEKTNEINVSVPCAKVGDVFLGEKLVPADEGEYSGKAVISVFRGDYDVFDEEMFKTEKLDFTLIINN